MAHWQPLQPAELILDERKVEAFIAESRKLTPPGTPFDEASCRAAIMREISRPLWKNWLYQVAVHPMPILDLERMDGKPGALHLVHLSIKQLDQRPARDWRHLQRIKNQLLGPECEAVELFPKESRLVDIANQTHLWGYDDPFYRFPFGFDQGRVVDDNPDPALGARQRKFAP